MLRYHIDRMGLETSGHLKADLQLCLSEAVRNGHSGKGGHAPKRTSGRAAVAVEKKGSGSGGGEDEDGDGDDAEPQEETERGRERASQGDARGRRKRADQKDKSPVPVLPPDRVRFHNVAVSAMTPDEMREAMHELDVASLRKDEDEIIHDLVDALVLRKAEAADMQSRKQAWRGRAVYMMRKAELADMLRDFELDDTGKVEELRTRFRTALRKWAAEEIKLPTSGARGGGRASAGTGGAGAGAFDSEEKEDKTEVASDAGESSATDRGDGERRRGRSTRHTLSEDATVPQPKPKPKPSKSSRASRKSAPKKIAEKSRSRLTSASRRGGKSSSGTTVGGEGGPTKARRTPSRHRPGDEQDVLSPKRAASSKTTGKGPLSG